MSSNTRKTIAVFGATGQQGGAVVRALQDQGAFKVRALTRDPAKHRALAEEVVEANLDRPEAIRAALEGAHGVFLVTNFWQPGTDERRQAASAVRAAKDAGVKHFIWSTLPDAEAISGGRFPLPHFSGKAKIDNIVREAGFAHHTFVVAPFYYQNLAAYSHPRSSTTDHSDGRCRSLRRRAASPWAISRSWAASWLEHSRIPNALAMATICRSWATSFPSATSSTR